MEYEKSVCPVVKVDGVIEAGKHGSSVAAPIVGQMLAHLLQH